MAKTYYEGTYSGENDPPTCSSSDGVRPDPWVNSRQSELCAECPQNKWGSAKARSGKRAKACRDSKRLMVVMAKELSEKGEDATIFILNVTINSLKALTNYGKALVQNQTPMSACITTVHMEEDAEVPELSFSMAGYLNQDLGMKALTKAAAREWESFDQRQISHQSGGDDRPRQGGQMLADPTKQSMTHTAVSTQGAGGAAQSANAAAQDEGVSPDSVDDLLNSW